MQTESAHRQRSCQQLVVQSLAALLLGVFIFLCGMLLVTGVYQAWYANRILPGITVDQIGIGGMTTEQAAAILNGNLHFTATDQIILRYGNANIEVDARQLGITFDAQATAENAYQFSRSGSLGAWFARQLRGNFSAQNIPATFTFDQSTAYTLLKKISLQYDRPPIEASLQLQGTQVVSLPGQPGQQLEMDASLERIYKQTQELNLDLIVLPVKEIAPELLDANAYAELAQEILKQPFQLVLPAQSESPEQAWQISPEELAPLLTFERAAQDDKIQLVPQLKTDYLNAYLEDLSQQIEIRKENPRFMFNDESGELELLTAGIEGQEIDLESSRNSIQTALARGQSTATLAVNRSSPEIGDDVRGAELGITELVHSERSYFFGSNTARIQNIEKAAEQFHGLLVPPNSTFSMAEAMDEISLDNGYAEALIIYNNQTIEGVGGGVCQVSTTLFRTAFFAGFPIIERHPHAYRVSYYEKTARNQRDNLLAGLDATVYVPIIDLKFVNDTPYWLLMETYVDRSANRITWKFYSTSDGRTVEWNSSGLTNIKKPPKPEYRSNPELDSGEIRQIEWEADGADVRIDRKVMKDGAILFEDTITTRYQPWQAVYEYGPGTEGIPTEKED